MTEFVKAYLQASEELTIATQAAEDARVRASVCYDSLEKAKSDLALSVGYKLGDPPLSVNAGSSSVIRLSTKSRDRECGSYRNSGTLTASVERIV